jgi:KDO2-lipid IV(A) lauroyltransferase
MRFWRRLNHRLLLRYRLEYVTTLAFVYGVRALSPRVAWLLARWIGRMLFRFGARRKAVLTNLEVAFPDMGAEERRRMAMRVYEHFASMIMDVLLQTRMLRKRNVLERIRLTGWARNYMDEHGPEGLRRRAHKVLFLTAHLGNWELASGFFSLLGVQISPVYRAMRNPFVDRLFRKIRLDSQYEVIERRGAVQSMMERFEQGGNIGFLFDQEALHGIYVPFFGVPACTHKTPAVLARDYDVKIFLFVGLERGTGRASRHGLVQDRRPPGGPRAHHRRPHAAARGRDPPVSRPVLLGAPALEARGRARSRTRPGEET